MRTYASTLEIRATRQVLGCPGDRQAPIFATRAKVGFGGEYGNSRAARADGAVVWVWNRRTEQLARMERDLAAHTMVLGTAEAAKWVSRQENRLTQPRATIRTSMPAGRCGRPTAEAAERRLEAGVFAASKVATR